VPDRSSVKAEAALETAIWRRVSWRRGTKTRLADRFAALRTDHPSIGERKYYLSNLLADTPFKDLVQAIETRGVCEQAYQQLKEELGLDHFEGRSWIGLQRHDGLCPSPILLPQGSRAEKKPSQVRRFSLVCQRSFRRFLVASSDDHADSALPAAGRSVHPHHRKCQSSAKPRTLA